MSTIQGKIILKSTTSKTLNDRFTELSRQLKSPPQVTISGLRAGQMQQHQASAKNRRLAAQMANRPGVQAALGQTPRGATSVQNRLGNQSKPSIQGRLGGNKMRGMLSPSRGSRQQGKIAPGRLGQRRGVVSKRGVFGRGRGNQNRFGRGDGGKQGIARGGMGRGGMGRGGKTRGNRGRGGVSRGRARGGQNQPTTSRDDLDKELDEYMTHSKSHLDAELDQYMQGAANDE